MLKTIVLNGKTFTVVKSKNTDVLIENLKRYAYRSIYDCYTNPSRVKVDIYKDWEIWSFLNDVKYFGVSGYNGYQFSLQGLVEHLGHSYILRITANNKVAYILD